MTLDAVIALSVILPNSVAFWADYGKVVEDTFCGRNVGQRMQFLAITYGDIGRPLARA